MGADEFIQDLQRMHKEHQILSGSVSGVLSLSFVNGGPDSKQLSSLWHLCSKSNRHASLLRSLSFPHTQTEICRNRLLSTQTSLKVLAKVRSVFSTHCSVIAHYKRITQCTNRYVRQTEGCAL